MDDAVIQAIGFLDGLANRLDGWARQSRSGGWSTHQVDENLRAANDCRRMAAILREARRCSLCDINTKPPVCTVPGCPIDAPRIPAP